MTKLRVLSLGWEFPPLFNGGLGIACHGITKALSSKVDVSLILPKTNTEKLLENVELIGLNNLDIQKLREIEAPVSYEEIIELEHIKADFLPYQEQQEIVNTKITMKEKKNFEAVSEIEKFDITELYGGDVVEKIHKYAQIAVKIALTKEFDVIYAHDWMTFVAGCNIKSATKKPLVLHVHALETDRSEAGNQNLAYHIEKGAMEYADRVVAVSKFTADQIVRLYNINPDKVDVIHNGIEPVKAYKSPKNIPGKMVLFLGRLTDQKGPGYFIELAQRILKKYPDAYFVMAGTGDKLKTLIENSANKNISTRFHFTGFLNREKVFQLYSMADVYVMPSVSEPFGLSALEAAQFGVPCIISKQSGVAEVLKGALKADFWDISTMSKLVTEMLENEEARDKVIADTFIDLQYVSWDKTAEKITKSFDRAIKNLVTK
ncbi:MAG: glycosyltransferase [Cytophagales bacterium]